MTHARLLVAALVSAGALACNTSTPADSGQCTSSAGCKAGEFCTAGACYPKVPTGACADTAEHSAADVCVSGLCVGGGCCTAACAAGDPACGAMKCDPGSGACQFPGSVMPCGPPESCTGGSLTAISGCDGRGGCSLAQPQPCATGACADSHRCVSACQDNSGCQVAEYCASGKCESKLTSGASCGPTSTSPIGSDCASGACLGSRCCASSCDTKDGECGATGCDSSGACVYPDPATPCGAPPACVGSNYSPQASCNGQGLCLGSPASCEPYVCNGSAPVCYSACTLGGVECAADGYCDAQRCALRGGPGTPCLATGTSTANQACLSGICSVNCCSVDCQADPATNNCKGTCDTSGSCTPQTCPGHFGCSGTVTCNTQCATNAECDAQAFCDPGATACCSRFAKGDTIYIDGVNGSDASPCCGAQATPCQTITHAMAMVAGSATSGAVLNVLNGDGTSSWTAAETYPIHLGWGVTLLAPSLYFANQVFASDVFRVYGYDATDTATVTIEGAAGAEASGWVHIGFDPNLANSNSNGAYNNSKVGVNDAVSGQTSLPLILSGVWLNANDNSGASFDLTIGAGANVTLGPDPVYLGDGNLLGSRDPNLYGFKGISCTGAGATLQDDPAATSPVLTIESRFQEYLDIEDGCTATLTQGPTLGGQATTPAGWSGTGATCPSGTYCQIACVHTAGSGAVVVAGSGKVMFGSAQMPGLIRCANYGFDQEISNSSGSPSVVVNSTIIDLLREQYYDNRYAPPRSGSDAYTCAGAMVTEGTFSATASTFVHSYLGVFVGGNATSADLSGGGEGGNAFSCNGNAFGAYYDCSNNAVDLVPLNGGADVVNETAAIGINAQNGTWDDWTSTDDATQVWSCTDTTYSDCTCSGPNCSSYTSPGTPPDGADAIYLSTNTAATPLDTSAGSQSSAASCQ